MSKDIVVAKILTSHGVKGFIKLESYFENPKDVFKYKNTIHDSNGNKFDLSFIGTARDNVFISKINDVNDMDKAKSLANTELFININELPKNKENEFYYNELIDLKVKSLDNKSFGTIKSVNDFGGGVVVEIKWDNEKIEESLPFIDSYFKEVNVIEGYVVVDRPLYV